VVNKCFLNGKTAFQGTREIEILPEVGRETQHLDRLTSLVIAPRRTGFYSSVGGQVLRAEWVYPRSRHRAYLTQEKSNSGEGQRGKI
jgi:hypothetical protein